MILKTWRSVLKFWYKLDRWVIAKPDNSCDEACQEIGKVCSEGELKRQNSQVDGCKKLQILIRDVEGLNVTNCNSDFPTHPDVPNLNPEKPKTLLVSGRYRNKNTFDCSKTPSPANKRRICYCHGRYHIKSRYLSMFIIMMS